jgi:hypothetical protein
MYTPGQQLMQSAAILQRHAGDRPSFEATVCRTFSTRPYQVFAMPGGLLFLELRQKAAGRSNTNAVVVGAVLGGAIGACLGAALADGFNADNGTGENFDSYNEDQLYQLAASRKRSFVAKIDEIISATIRAPGAWSRLFVSSGLAGWVTLRDRKLGRVTMEIHNQADLSVAVDALPRRLGDRAFVNVEFDRQTTTFRPKGR